MKIRAKINWMFLSLFLVAMMLIGVLMGSQGYATMKAGLGGELGLATQLKSDHVESYVEFTIQKLNLTSSRTKLRNSLAAYLESADPDDADAMLAILEDAIESIEDFKNVSILSMEGEVLVTTDHAKEGEDFSGEGFFVEGQKEAGVFAVESEES